MLYWYCRCCSWRKKKEDPNGMFVTGEEAPSVPGKQRETWPPEFRRTDKMLGK